MNNNNSLWTEKYRPKSPDDLDAPPHIKRFLGHAMKNGHPHLLLYGPPGTGKTTFAAMLGPTLVLNASDERGIDVIRNKIKKIANTVSKQVIILDECENLTRDSQTCLRRILEDYPNTTFIFCTNYYSRVIDPLKSRLLKLKFAASTGACLARIGQVEGLEMDGAFYAELFSKCNGDLRKCINVLQGIRPLYSDGENTGRDENRSNADKEGKVLKDSVHKNLDNLIGRIPSRITEAFAGLSFTNYRAFVSSFIFEGYSTLQLVQQLSEGVHGTQKQKCLFSLLLSESESCCVKGCSDEIVLMNLCLKKMSIY